jgi:hypothetical protein
LLQDTWLAALRREGLLDTKSDGPCDESASA